MTNDRDALYVGYLPAPAGHRRFAKAAFLTALLTAVCAGSAVAWLMDDPGQASWASEESELAGTLWLEPTAFLETAEGPVLLVEIGKFGPRNLALFGEGAAVAVRGTLLEREGRRMIELAARDDAVERAAHAARDPVPSTTGPTVTIQGEIVDTKCYLGAMKPGQGRTHAACARLCIRGGIPAAVVGTANGGPIWAVIDPGEAGIISESLLNAVGERALIQGEVSTSAGLDALRNARLIEGE